MSVNKNVKERIEAHAVNLQRLKPAANRMVEAADLFRDRMRDLEVELSVAHSGDIECKELERAVNRMERLEELRRMMEIGAFKLTIERVVDVAWKRLP